MQSMYLMSSQILKSIIVRQSRNHVSPTTACSSFSRRGQTFSVHCISLNLFSSSADFCWQFIVITFPMYSMVQIYISTSPLSRMVRPSRSDVPKRLITQTHMGTDSVTTKVPSRRQGRQEKAHQRVFSVLKRCHSASVNSLSLQSTPRYSQSKRQT